MRNKGQGFRVPEAAADPASSAPREVPRFEATTDLTVDPGNSCCPTAYWDAVVLRELTARRLYAGFYELGVAFLYAPAIFQALLQMDHALWRGLANHVGTEKSVR